MTWDMWKKSFDVWENETAKFLEVVMKSPMMLGPSGKLLSNVMKAKSAYSNVLATVWSGIGLPTKRDQERILHALNQLESKLMDLEERLEDQTPKS